MVSVGTSLCELHSQHTQLSARDSHKWSPHSSLEATLLNLPLPHKLQTVSKLCSFTAPLRFPRWTIIDQELKTGAGVGGFSRVKPVKQDSTFVLPGLKLVGWRKVESGTRDSALVRAQRISQERPRGGPDYPRNSEEEEEGEERSVWDSNAEGVRRGRAKQRAKVNYGVGAAPRDRSQEANGYWREEFQRREWDYDAEVGPSREERPRNGSRWWESKEDSDAYEFENGAGEASTSFMGELVSWFNMNFKDALVFLRWGLPAGVLLVPWLMGNPTMLLIGLTFIPAAQKLIGPIANQIFRLMMSGSSPPRPKRKRKQSSPSPSSRSRGARAKARETSTTYPSLEQDSDIFSSASTTIFGDPNVDDTPRQPSRLDRSAIGSGWEELEEDRARARAERWPLGQRKNLERKLVKREQNMFVRLLLAFFPFLRYWGGFM